MEAAYEQTIIEHVAGWLAGWLIHIQPDDV
jgi:hypothetical protein